MIIATQYQDTLMTVLGLGKSGRSLCASLTAGGAQVVTWDDGEAARTASPYPSLSAPVLPVDTDFLAISPGIAPTHPLYTQALQRGVPIITDLDVLFQHAVDATFVGVTGTNGKSTTTALLGHVLREAGRNVAVVGNIGTPVLDAELADIFVIEASSYQLEYSKHIGFKVAIWLNLTPDHLERHGDMAGYKAAKERIFRGFREGHTAVIGVDDAISANLAAAMNNGASVVPISGHRLPAGGIGVQHGEIVDALYHQPLCSLSDAPRLVGTHNAQNMAAVCAAALALDIPLSKLQQGIASFTGLAHRQEWCGEIAGVAYINDSKATNADATATALVCYERIHWIVGGKAKSGGIDSLVPYFPRIVTAYLIGEAAPAFAKVLAQYGVAHVEAETVGNAVTLAHKAAKAGEVVLLSPACASFDQFQNFEQRGDVFRNAVETLKHA